MRLRNLFFPLLLSPVLLMPTACSDENEPRPPKGEYVPEESVDIANGSLVHMIDIADIDDAAFEIPTMREVNLDVTPNEYVGFSCEKRGDKWYVVPRLLRSLDKPFVIVCVKISPREYPEMARSVLMVVRDSSSSTRAEGPQSVYSSLIGQGTRCYLELGNTTLKSVLLYDQISKLGEDYFNYNTTMADFSMVEFSGDDYEKTMEQWAFNIGASFQKTIKPKIAVDNTIKPDGTIIPRGSALGSPKMWTGTFNFGMDGSVSQSEAYEYYFNLYTVKMSEVALHTDAFEKEVPDSTLLVLLSKNFVADATGSDFDAVKFYDAWGTDVITQGSFGGYNIYVYGRKENVYENSVGFDACANLKRSTPENAGSTWLEVYKNKASDYAQGNFDVSYMNENYSSASRSVGFQHSTGGDMAINDPQRWLDGFNEDNSDNSWALISYRISGDEPSDTAPKLYPIENFVYEYACVYDYYVKDKSEADINALNRIIANYNALVDAKPDYLDSKQKQLTGKNRLVVADIISTSESNGHKSGQPQPFVAQDPNDQNKYLIYYPFMANPNAPCDNGHAFETSQDDYIVGVDTDDKYWYYAMAPADECRGIVDAVFATDGEAEDFTDGKYYVRRGINAEHNSGVAPKKKYIYLKYYDEGVDKDPNKKITALGFMNKNNNKIIASTGGSELRPNATQTEEQEFNAFWDPNGFSWYKRPWDGWCFNEGSVTVHNPFYMVFTNKELAIKHFKEDSVWQPAPW